MRYVSYFNKPSTETSVESAKIRLPRRASSKDVGSAARALGRWFLLFVLPFLLVPHALHAQFSGNLQGTVTDDSGAAIPAANITLLNVDTKVSQKATADSQGSIISPAWRRGTTRLRAEWQASAR